MIPLADTKGSDKATPAPAQIVPALPPKDSAATMMEETLEQTVADALNHVRPDQLIGPRPDEELIKGTAYSSSAWLHAPGQLELLAHADARLTRIGNAKPGAEAQVGRVDRVEARLVPGTKLLVLRAAADKDLTAEAVTRRSGESSAWVNLYALLKPAKLTVTTGYRQLYAVSYVPKTSPLWPALVIDLDKPIDRRQQPKRKKKSES